MKQAIRARINGAHYTGSGAHTCGASILAHGVGGATNSGVQTAAKILNCKAEDLIKPIEGQHVRIYDAEDNSQWPQWIHDKIKDRERRFRPLSVI